MIAKTVARTRMRGVVWCDLCCTLTIKSHGNKRRRCPNVYVDLNGTARSNLIFVDSDYNNSSILSIPLQIPPSPRTISNKWIAKLNKLALRFSKDRAQFLPGGLIGLPVVVVHRRARLNSDESMYLIRTGCPSSDINRRYWTGGFSSSGVRYCSS